MDNAGYTTIGRQSGLIREMRLIANNIANMNTTGFRAQGMTFSEYVTRAGPAQPSLSMSTGRIAPPLALQGNMTLTGADLDLAIEGDGFFLIGTPEGERLTRAGHFTLTAEGNMVTQDGHAVLDAGGAPVILPPTPGQIGIGPDGTISIDGAPMGQVGMVRVAEPLALTHEGGTLFAAPAWEPDETSRLQQGALENSNVDPMIQMSRMVEVQRAYELGQSFLDNEDRRITSVIDTLGK